MKVPSLSRRPVGKSDSHRARVGTVQHAHIHEAGAGKNGPVVVTLFMNQAFSGTGSATGCDRNDSTRAEVRRILNNPAGFYVNVHDSVRPAGAIRGQLER